MRYFNYAGLTPARPEVVRAIDRAAETFGTLLFSESGIVWYRKQVEECSDEIAALLNIRLGRDCHSLLLCPNATSSARIVLSMLGLQAGDLVITSDHEHPSTLQALSGLRQKGIGLKVIPALSEAQFLAELEEACRERTVRLLIQSHVAHSDGRVFPIQQICEIAGRRDIMVAIDGAQAVGHIPVNVGALAVDFYYFSGHKWCAGPMGSGALVITERYKRRAAWHETCRLENGPSEDNLNLGTQNIGLIAGLGLACKLRRHEWPALTRLAELRTLFSRRLSSIREVEIAAWDAAQAPGILSFRVKKAGFDPTRMAAYLSNQHGVVLKPIRYSGFTPMLRASWSLTTQDPDILFLAEKLEETLERLPRHRADALEG
jgi:selenocysteine lyase/cysteine desulfurase